MKILKATWMCSSECLRTWAVLSLVFFLPGLLMASGEWLPYVSDGGTTGTEFNVFAVNLSSGVKTQLTSSAFIDNHPDISPNGAWVVWSSTRGNGEFDLYLGDFTNLDATARRLTDDSYTNGPQTRYPDRHCHFRSDGRTIIFSSKNRSLDSPIVVISECSVPKIIDPPRFYEGLNIISLTSTGTVAGYRELDIRDAWDSATYPGIWTNSSGTYAGHPSFSPDGANIVFSGSIDGEGKVWEVYTVGYNALTTNLVANSLRRRTLGPAVGRNPIQMSGGAHFSYDGLNILFSSTRTLDGNSQIYSIPNSGTFDSPLTVATKLTFHRGNDYVPEPLSNGSFVVVTDLGTNNMCGLPDPGPTADLDLVIVSPDGTRTDLVALPGVDDMSLIADEVSWFCGLPPNLSDCIYMPRTVSIESLYLQKSAWLYLQGHIESTLIPSGLLSAFGYSDKAIYMYNTGWENMDALMSQKNPSQWGNIMIWLQQMHADFSTFPGLNDAAALRTWMLSTDSIRNLKVVVPSIMHGRGIGTQWVSIWTNLSGGNFTDPANWGFGLPGSNDVARFSGLTGMVDTVVVRLTNQVDVGKVEIDIEIIQLHLVGPGPIIVHGPVTVGGGTGVTSVLVTNLTLSADDIAITNNGELRMIDSFFDVFDKIEINDSGLLHISGGRVAAADLRVAAGGELRGNGEIHAHAQIAGRVSPGDSVGTLTFKSNLVFQSGQFACHAASDTSLDKIIADGAVSGTGTVIMTASSGAAPAYQVIINGSDASDYSGFSVTPAADWRLVTLANGKLAVTKTGAGRADPAIVNSAGNWYVWLSGQSYALSGPHPLAVIGTPLAADFDGDGKGDPAGVSATGGWYVWLSGQSYALSGPHPLGVIGTPLAADFDGDGLADPAGVSASGNWYFWLSGQSYALSGPHPLGVIGTPVAADFDGDGLGDPAGVSATGGWYVWLSGQSYALSGPHPLGVIGTPLAADFDGDGRADPAGVSASGNLYFWLSSQSYALSGPHPLGVIGTPLAADFDGK